MIYWVNNNFFIFRLAKLTNCSAKKEFFGEKIDKFLTFHFQELKRIAWGKLYKGLSGSS